MAPTPCSSSRLTLVLGGARSGKSRYAEGIVTALPPPWVYIATAEAHDAEMEERIAAHRARRSGQWRTRDAPLDLPGVIAEEGRVGSPLLVDCLTLWLSNVMLAGRDVADACGALMASLGSAAGPVVLVSSEVGLGIVPENALARRFRDAQGRLNQDLAMMADRVVLVAAGLPLELKSSTMAKGGVSA